jgi:hypothetical protein
MPRKPIALSPAKPITEGVYTSWRDRPLLPLKAASEIVGVSTASLYRFADEGKLRFRQLAGRTLVDTKSLIALIDAAEDWTPKSRGAEARAKRREIARASHAA